MKNLKILLILSLLSVSTAFSGHGKEGGELRFVSMAEIASYIANDLKRDLLKAIEVVRTTSVESLDSTLSGLDKDSDLFYINELEQLIDKGIKQDIIKSPYNIRNLVCYDSNGNEKDASSKSLDKGGEICWGPSRILQNGSVLKSELIGLAFHEHVHHFGIKDEEIFGHPRAALFSKYIRQYWESRKNGYGLVVKITTDHNKKICNFKLVSEFYGENYKLTKPTISIVTDYTKKERRKLKKKFAYDLNLNRTVKQLCNKSKDIISLYLKGRAVSDFRVDGLPTSTKIYVNGSLKFNSNHYLAAVALKDIL